MKILVTGGTGYIGSHTCVELLNGGHDVVIVDNLSNSKLSILDRIEKIAGRRPVFVEADVRNETSLEAVFSAHAIDAVIHFAGLKAVGESVEKPLYYYDNNVTGSMVLFNVMAKFGVKTVVFSSSATVYGDPDTVPILENFPMRAASPYGRSKWMVEEMLRDIGISDPSWRIALLRYFNPVGAHESGLIGEDPNGIPNNLMPFIAQVAEGRREMLSVFGSDYPTTDGTGERDYIHVVDLAIGHVKTLDKLAQAPGLVIYNLGTGKANSVLQVISAFEKASGKTIPYKVVGRRHGDVAAYYADPSLAESELGWRAERNLEQMCADSWRWQSSFIA
jgi:UDP-glucose 4-epimerase